MDEQDVRPLAEQWSALDVGFWRLVLVSFPPSDVQTSFEGCDGTAWCGIHGVAYPRILLAVVDSTFFSRLSVQCLYHGGCIRLSLAL